MQVCDPTTGPTLQRRLGRRRSPRPSRSRRPHPGPDPRRALPHRALRRRHRALLGLSESAVSHQLRLLRSMRLVRPRRDGRHDLLHARRSAHRPPLRAGARARAGERARRSSRRIDRHDAAVASTCTVCELHAESTFKDRRHGLPRGSRACIERRFKHLPGLEEFSADLMGQRLHVKYDAAKLSTVAIAAAVADAGMRAWLEHEEPVAPAKPAPRRAPAARWSRPAWRSGAGLLAGAFARRRCWLTRAVRRRRLPPACR